MGPEGFPRRFDSYVLLKPLARGGMGQLYLALSGTHGLEKPCVIKHVPPELVAPENARRFRDEAMVVLRLAHGNLVSVFDAGMSQGQIFIAMEYVDGRDLHAVWNRCADRQTPFPVDVAVYIIKELARGLAYAHAFENLQLVHRDVSPANVLLSFSGEVKLTDFGLATSVLKIERTAPGIVYGKLSYLAPEQARREPLDGRTDIYSAGILLWELLTGRQLFPVGRAAGDDASSPSEANANALYRARNPEVMPPSRITDRVPPELDRIVLRALAAERQDRYPDGEALRADLASFLAQTAPKTDAARLASFLRPLFADDIRADRSERDRLIADAARLMSGGLAAHPRIGGPAPAAHPAPAAAEPAPTPAGHAAAARPGRPGEDPRVGTTIGGRYFVRRLCGEGAMGRVYEAHHIDIGRRVAIKVLHQSFLASADLVERFRREARAASRIGHENIVDVTDSGSTADGAFYFVMEYLDGVNLEQLIDGGGPLAPERALLIAAQIARALEAAHSGGIIHRDLKPANVMLVNRKNEEDFVKVLDFGISKDLDAENETRSALTRPNVAIGTPVYMAPEQAAGKPAGVLTDVYGVGGLLYEMLTGQPPCAGGDAMAVLAHKASYDPPPVRALRPDLPVGVERLVMRALSRAPSDRHASMTALKEDLLANLAGSGADTGAVLAQRPSRQQRTEVLPAPVSGPLRREPRRVVIGVGAGAFVVLAIAFVATRSSGPDTAPIPAAAPVVLAPAPLPREETVAAEPVPPVPATPSNAAAVPPTAPLPSRPVPVAGSWPESARTLPAAGRRTTADTVATPVQGSQAPRKRDSARPIEAAPRLPGAATPLAATSEVVLSRGQLAFDRGDYPEAVRRGREAIAAGATVGGRLLVGDAYYRLERYADATREYQALLAADPADATARRRLDLAQQAAARSR
jgi:serine/threonine protein kinase